MRDHTRDSDDCKPSRRTMRRRLSDLRDRAFDLAHDDDETDGLWCVVYLHRAAAVPFADCRDPKRARHPFDAAAEYAHEAAQHAKPYSRQRFNWLRLADDVCRLREDLGVPS